MEAFDIFSNDYSEIVSQNESSVAQNPSFAFIVDCSKDMTNDFPKNYILDSLVAIRIAIQRYIFKSRSCYVAVLLMATKKSENAANVKNVCTIIPMIPAGAEFMKKLDEFIKMASTSLFTEEYGVGEFRLSEALWIASTLLQESKRKLRKHIILFTNCQDPFPKQQDRIRTYSKMADFEQSKTCFLLVPMGSRYDPEPFKELLEAANSPVCSNPVTSAEEAANQIPSPKKCTWPLAHLKFFITSELSVPVGIKTLATRVNLPISQPMSAATNAPVVSKTVQKVVDLDVGDQQADDPGSSENSGGIAPGEVVESPSILRCVTIAGKTIAFTKDEMDEISAFGECEMRLLGFKPKEWMSLELHLQPCGFVYPVEATATGASTLFIGLLERCEAKGVVPVCSYCPRRTSPLRQVVLAPSSTPRGFIMIYLPFGDEVRDIDVSQAASGATPQQVDLMKELVKKMRFSYQPAQFSNPKLQSFWVSVEALALDLFEPEPITDSSVPDYEMLRKRLDNLPERIMDQIYGGSYAIPTGRSKPPQDPMADIAAVQTHYTDGTMLKLTVAQLKSYLMSVGLGAGLATAKKAQLVEIAQAHLKKTNS